MNIWLAVTSAARIPIAEKQATSTNRRGNGFSIWAGGNFRWLSLMAVAPMRRSNASAPSATAAFNAIAHTIEPAAPPRGNKYNTVMSRPIAPPRVLIAYSRMPSVSKRCVERSNPWLKNGSTRPMQKAGGRTIMAERTVLTVSPGHWTRRSIPSIGQIQSDQAGRNSIGNAKKATPASASATMRQGRFARLSHFAAAAEPSANPRKKKPKTRLVDCVLAPSKSTKRRVQSSSWVSAAKPLASASAKAKRNPLRLVFWAMILGAAISRFTQGNRPMSIVAICAATCDRTAPVQVPATD